MDKKQDVVYCPFYEVDVKIWSEMIEKLGTFPMFVLTSLSDLKNTVDKIITSTNLNPSNVIDTVEELIENGLLQKSNNNEQYIFTHLGKTYLKINRYLEEFSHTKKSRIAVNAFTGLIEGVSNESFYSITTKPDGQILPIKVSKLLVKNHNFANIKDFMKDRIDLSDFQISDNDYEYINFDLKPKQIFYVPYIVSKESFSLIQSGEHQIILRTPIEKVKRIVSHNETECYKDIMKQVMDISIANDELLSDQGKLLIYISKKIEELNSKAADYYNCYTGEKIYYQPNFEKFKDIDSKFPAISLSRIYRKQCKPSNLNNGFIVTYDVEHLVIENVISFDSLIQME